MGTLAAAALAVLTLRSVVLVAPILEVAVIVAAAVLLISDRPLVLHLALLDLILVSEIRNRDFLVNK